MSESSVNKFDLQKRNKSFVLNVVYVCTKLPKNQANEIFMHQVIRSSSSVGANYRAACIAKSSKDFINKLKIVEEEADESAYFLDLLSEINSEHREVLLKLVKEASELTSIFVSSIKTARKNLSN